MNAIVQHQPQAVSVSSNSMIPTSMEGAIRLAEMMAKWKMAPEHLRGSPGDMLMVIEQAMRWGMSPFAVAQCTSSIKGKLMWEGKLVAAAIENSGAIIGLLDYQFSGEGQGRKITVTGTRKGETSPRTVEIALKDVVTENGIWKKQPDQQLVYAGARIWGRRWTPGVVLGVYAPEEFAQVQAETFGGTTIEADAQPVQQIAPPAPKKQTVSSWLDALQSDLNEAASSEGVDSIISRADVQAAMDKLGNGARDRLNAMVNAAIKRTAPDDGIAEEDPALARTMAGYGDERTLGA